MSVIGPRPGLWNQDILTAERDKYGANDVKPGLTGWAQINGRDELEIPDKAKLDGDYVHNMGLKMDTFVYASDTKKRYVHIYYSASKAAGERARLEESIQESLFDDRKLSNCSREYIPNEEVKSAFGDAVQMSNWSQVIEAVKQSEWLLRATLQKDAEGVAKGIDTVHENNTSILNYNDENALSCAIALAYYNAMNDYMLVREMPLGKGYADIVFLPKKPIDYPALVVELKYDQSETGAIEQIKEKHYAKALEDYTGEILLVGINYDKKSKKHSCVIESWRK